MGASVTRRNRGRSIVSAATGAALVVTGLVVSAVPATASPTGTDQNVVLAIANYGGPEGMTATFLAAETELNVCGDVNTGGACNFLFTSEIDEVADTFEDGPAFEALPLAGGFGNGAFGQIFTPTVSGDLTAFTISLACLDQTAAGIEGLEAAIFETDEEGLSIVGAPLAGGAVDLTDCPTDTTSTHETWQPDTFAPITLPVSGAVVVAGHHYAVLFGGSFVGGVQPPGLSSTPNAPTALGVAPGNARLTVAFTAPSDDGGSAITDYEWTTDGGATWHSAGRTTSPVTITGLTNGTEYTVKLRAVNANGNGGASETATGTPVAPAGDTVRPRLGTWTATAGHQTALRLLRTTGSPAATLATSTPARCSVQGSLVIFHVAGTCTVTVRQGGTVWKTLSTVVSSTARPQGSASPDAVRSVTFGGNSASLTSTTKAKLRAMAPTLRSAHFVVVHGFVSGDRASGTTAEAWRLSEARAAAVATYLRSLGVRVLYAHGYSTWLPLSAANPWSTQNRRADVAWL